MTTRVNTRSATVSTTKPVNATLTPNTSGTRDGEPGLATGLEVGPFMAGYEIQDGTKTNRTTRARNTRQHIWAACRGAYPLYKYHPFRSVHLNRSTGDTPAMATAAAWLDHGACINEYISFARVRAPRVWPAGMNLVTPWSQPTSRLRTVFPKRRFALLQHYASRTLEHAFLLWLGPILDVAFVMFVVALCCIAGSLRGPCIKGERLPPVSFVLCVKVSWQILAICTSS